MNTLLLPFRKFDWMLIASAISLTGFGLISLYSSSLGQAEFLSFHKQIIFFGIGLFLMFAIGLIDYRALKSNPFFILTLYCLCLLGLLGLFFWAPEIRGVKGWYKLGSVSIDPIELLKIVLIILLAKYFSMRHIEMYRVKHILLSGLYVFLPAALIFFQPDLGSVLILLAVWIVILIVSGIKLRHFLILCFIGFLIFLISWSFLMEPYQKERILSFITPQFEPLGAGWSQAQSKIAIGSGGVFGQGIGQGSQTQYGFLPEPKTDFIFAAIAEETGLVGVGILFALFSIFIWRILRIAFLSDSNFSRLFSVGFATLIMCQVFIHIGMNLGILPIIGISLPLVSYGGSGLIMTFVGIGLLMSIKTH